MLLARRRMSSCGSVRGQFGRGFGREVGGHVAERIVGARLVGDDVGREVHLEQLRDEHRRVADETDRQRPLLVAGPHASSDRILQRVGDLVEVAGLDASTDSPGIDVDAQRHAAVHRHGQRLRTAHATKPGRQRDRAGERAAELAAGDLGEALVGALQDSLRADVDPRPGGHLPVHRQAHRLEPPELLPVAPLRHEVRVGDQHPRRPLVGAEHADRLARLHEHRLVVGRAS